MLRKIILFGGTFDPIHNGHISVARYALKYIDAEQLLFIPARRSPHKQSKSLASGKDRLAMIELALECDKHLSVSDCELNRDEPSYTLDTIQYFHQTYGKDTELYWLIGADAVSELHRWHRIGEVLEKCNLCILCRPGYELPDKKKLAAVFGEQQAHKLLSNLLQNPYVDISSTQIRQMIASGEDVSSLTPAKVVEYIKKQHLYAAKQ